MRDKPPDAAGLVKSPLTAARAQVLRYSVLGLGILYGFSHQRTITATQKSAEAQREYQHKQQLINKAKDAYAKSKQPAAASTAAASGGEFALPRSFSFSCLAVGASRLTHVTAAQDLNSPNFDLEAFLEGVMNQK